MRGFSSSTDVRPPTPAPPQACEHDRTLSVFEDMQAAGVTPDRESYSAATEACASDSSGEMGARAIELMEAARTQAQGVWKPGARAVAASLAACVGGGHWRRAIPAVETMLDASGAHAWDDVIKLLRDVQLGREKRRNSAGRVVGSPPTPLPSVPVEDYGMVDVRREIVRDTGGLPSVNGDGMGGGAAVAPPPAGGSRGSGIEGYDDLAPGTLTSAVHTCTPLTTRRLSESVSNGSAASSDEDSRELQRHGKSVSRGAAAAAVSF